MKVRITQWIILGLLVLMIFHPIFHFKKKVSPYGILLIDQSESMKKSKRIKIDLPHAIKKFYFGSKMGGTDIGEGIHAAVKTYPDASFIVLYSDGSNTKGKNPISKASEIVIPIYYIIPNIAEERGGFISMFGPDAAEEGDSVKIAIYYKVPGKAQLAINYEREIIKKDIKKEGIYDFSLIPTAGKKNIQTSLLIEQDTVDKINWTLDVKKKRKLLIVSEISTWNYKFIKRYFEDRDWNVAYDDKIDHKNLMDVDIICFLSDPTRDKETIAATLNYLKKGGKIIIVSPVSADADFLPLIAPVLSKYSGKLPLSYYIKAGGIKRNAKTLEIIGEKVGYSIPFSEGTVTQFTYLELWKLALSAGQTYHLNLFEKLMEQTLTGMIPEEIPVFYSKKLLEGEDFILRSDQVSNSKRTFSWDGQKIPIAGDSIIIKSPPGGVHNFKIDLPSKTIEDSVLVVESSGDRIGIDTLMLKSLGEVSGGGKLEKDFRSENLELKEKEIWINLRHNWFFIISLLLLLFWDWILWLRKKG